jgi:hypothetical protein
VSDLLSQIKTATTNKSRKLFSAVRLCHFVFVVMFSSLVFIKSHNSILIMPHYLLLWNSLLHSLSCLMGRLKLPKGLQNQMASYTPAYAITYTINCQHDKHFWTWKFYLRTKTSANVYPECLKSSNEFMKCRIFVV